MKLFFRLAVRIGIRAEQDLRSGPQARRSTARLGGVTTAGTAMSSRRRARSGIARIALTTNNWQLTTRHCLSHFLLRTGIFTRGRGGRRVSGGWIGRFAGIVIFVKRIVGGLA